MLISKHWWELFRIIVEVNVICVFVFRITKEGLNCQQEEEPLLTLKMYQLWAFPLLLNYVVVVELIKNTSLCACAFVCECV